MPVPKPEKPCLKGNNIPNQVLAKHTYGHTDGITDGNWGRLLAFGKSKNWIVYMDIILVLTDHYHQNHWGHYTKVQRALSAPPDQKASFTKDNGYNESWIGHTTHEISLW